MNVQINKNWVETVKLTIPEYASFLADKLDDVINTKTLSKKETHGVALAAALASGFGELAFEIAMSYPLFGDSMRDNISKIVVEETFNCTYQTYTSSVVPIITNTKDPELDVFRMAAIMAVGVQYANTRIQSLNIDLDKKTEIAAICSVIAALGKCIL